MTIKTGDLRNTLFKKESILIKHANIIHLGCGVDVRSFTSTTDITSPELMSIVAPILFRKLNVQSICTFGIQTRVSSKIYVFY